MPKQPHQQTNTYTTKNKTKDSMGNSDAIIIANGRLLVDDTPAALAAQEDGDLDRIFRRITTDIGATGGAAA